MYRANHNVRASAFACMLSLFAFTTAIALPQDNKLPIHITANSSTYNYKTGINQFDGDVYVTQGTTHLTADRLITKSNSQRKIHEIIAYGFKNQAHYWTIPKLNDAEMHAKAKIIKMHPIAANITLEQDVTVLQGENSFQGQLIHYNNNDQTVTVPALEKAAPFLSTTLTNSEADTDAKCFIRTALKQIF